MHIQHNVSLRGHSTMRLGGPAQALTSISNHDQLIEVLEWAKKHWVQMMMIGHGSNIVWRDEGYSGLIIVNDIKGIDVIHEDGHNLTVRVGAGEVWDEVVAWAVKKELCGIECLSLIPGTAGATPVQNVGAYGSEIADTLIELEAYDVTGSKFVSIAAEDCGFGYRTSRFKIIDKNRFFITSITLKLIKSRPKPPFYESLQQYFDDNEIENIDVRAVRDAVINIRSGKLPDPKHIANCGSFFANPIVDSNKFESLKSEFSTIKGWPQDDGTVKVAAAWLVDKAGFRGMHDKKTGMSTWPNQALVLVNEHAKNTADLLAFRQKILNKVASMFGIKLEQEPELLP